MSPEAGQSAAELARLTREKIQRLERSAAAWEAGAVGEQATGQVLARLDPALWTTWHDVRWPGRQRANIDHVVVGPPGVFVIDSKNWSGTVELKGVVLRQNGCSREKEVVGVAEAGIAVLELVPVTPVHPVLCLMREESFSGWVRDVMLCSTGNLDVMIQTRPHVLSPEQVRATASRLEVGLTQGRRMAAPTQPRSRSTQQRSSRSSVLKLMTRLLAALMFAALLGTGLATPALTWFGDRVADVIVGKPPAQPTETPTPRGQKKDRPTKDREGKQKS